MLVANDFGSAELDDAVRAAGRKAFTAALASGVPVCYVDAEPPQSTRIEAKAEMRCAPFVGDPEHRATLEPYQRIGDNCPSGKRRP